MGNIPALHGLRGLAVVIVLLSHWGNAGHRLLPIPHDSIGKVGVWTFFALSAYLLTANLARDRNLTAYAVKRAVRIMPLYLLFIGLHVALGDIAAGDAWRHVVMIEAWQEAWAIPVEVTFYLLIPLIALPSRRVGTALALIGIGAALVAPAHDVFGNGLSIQPKLAPFALGSLVALWKPRLSLAWVAASVLGLALGLVAFREQAGNSHALSLLLGLSSVGLILACTQGEMVGRLFSSPVLVWLGKVSFSLYLLHMIALRLVPHGWLALGLTLIASAATYRWLELPAMRLGTVSGSSARQIEGASPPLRVVPHRVH